MLSKILSASVIGIEAHAVEVEVDITSRGLPHFSMVGLPDAAVKESRDRVRAALKNIGFNFPLKQITVNLAPADIPKEGPALDLPIAVGLLATSGQIEMGALSRLVVVGELSLDGELRPVTGVLPIAMKAKEAGYEGILVPAANAAEAAVVEGLNVYGAERLPEVVAFLNGDLNIPPFSVDIRKKFDDCSKYEVDFEDVKGQELVTLESMKMESGIGSPLDGTIDKILVTIGQAVENNQPLIQFAVAQPENDLSGHVKRQTHMDRLS